MPRCNGMGPMGMGPRRGIGFEAGFNTHAEYMHRCGMHGLFGHMFWNENSDSYDVEDEKSYLKLIAQNLEAKLNFVKDKLDRLEKRDKQDKNEENK